MHDAIVIGAGLFGQVIAAQLRSLGMETMLVDNAEPKAGSLPSASLMKPSWFANMGAQYTDPALKLLDRIYGVHELKFKVGPAKIGGVMWCDPRQIMVPEAVLADVAWVDRGVVSLRERGDPQRQPRYQTERRVIHKAKLIVVAAGVWSSKLLPVPGLTGKMGAAVRYKDTQIGEPFIRPWAPYKQLVAFNLGPDLWVGDGSAIKPENWTEERQAKTVERCSILGHRPGSRILIGTRPYVPKKYLNGQPCYLEEREPWLWIATGGAKNGTIAAGWCAHEIGKRAA